MASIFDSIKNVLKKKKIDPKRIIRKQHNQKEPFTRPTDRKKGALERAVHEANEKRKNPKKY